MSKEVDAHHRMVAEYVDKARQFPRIRSFFWLLRCADSLNKYAGMEVGKKGVTRTGLAVLQLLIKYLDGISQQPARSPCRLPSCWIFARAPVE